MIEFFAEKASSTFGKSFKMLTYSVFWWVMFQKRGSQSLKNAAN
jgi:hypothetical protein